MDLQSDEYDALASFKREVLRVPKPLPSFVLTDDAVSSTVIKITTFITNTDPPVVPAINGSNGPTSGQ